MVPKNVIRNKSSIPKTDKFFKEKKEPWNKGMFKIYKIPNDKTSPSRWVNMKELTMIYNGMIDEGF